HPRLYFQGNQVSDGVTSPRVTVTAPTQIGAGAYGQFFGDVAEILIFDRTLGETERRALEEFLANKYGLTLPTPFHTNFKLDADGEPVLLTRPNGARADALPAIALPRDVSYGRQPDGGASTFYFEQPTPGAANLTPGASELLGPPQFSSPGGCFATNVLLSITVTNPGATIRFTLDGSEPSASSRLYSSPILVTNRTALPNDISMI